MTDLLEAGVHFGHLTRKWNPKMKNYIYTARDDVHVIDLAITVEKLEEAKKAITELVKDGKRPLFVGTKRQAAVVLENIGNKNNIPFITQRWLGGLLTNFDSVKKTWARLNELEEMMSNEKEFAKLSTRDQFMYKKEAMKLNKLVGGLKNLEETPGFLFVVDVKREQTAIDEAKRVGLPIVALVDTNVDPSGVTYQIPGNDDGVKSIEIVTEEIVKAIKAGMKK